MKYILLGPTTGGYSHSLPYFIPGSYYFSNILGFILQIVISANRQYALCSKAVECPNSNLILNTHSKVLYRIMVSCMDEERLLKHTHSKSLEKLDKTGLNLKQNCESNSKLLCLLFTCTDLVWQITNFTSASTIYVWESNVSYCESSSSFVLVLSPLNA